MTRIHGFESEDVAEKYAVRLGVFAVVNHLRASKSFGSPGTPGRLHFPWNR